MGIPARYVSGYLLPKAKAKINDTIDGQSHAWVEAWTGGWWGYDPTNDIEINEQHICVAVGRDYAESRPSRASTPVRGQPTSTSSWRSPDWLNADRRN